MTSQFYYLDVHTSLKKRTAVSNLSRNVVRCCNVMIAKLGFL